jgi:polyhydroxyalkanoate synthesis repressor PhaR
MSSTRVIKKYPNRRLYDTEESRYITLADIKNLVMNKVDFEVIDKKSGENITRTILLQVISEHEQQGEAIMSEDFLAQIIRAYGSVVPDFMANYLEKSLSLFMQQQTYMQGQMQGLAGSNPLNTMTELTQQSFQRLQTLQEELLRQFAPSDGDSSSADTTTTGGQTKAG